MAASDNPIQNLGVRNAVLTTEVTFSGNAYQQIWL